MIGSTRSNCFGYIRMLCMLALLFAVAWPAAASAAPACEAVDPTCNENVGDVVNTGDPVVETGTGNGNGNGNGNGSMNGNGNGSMNGNGNGSMNGNGNGDDTMAGPHASVLSDRIVLHAATPAQLVKSGDGLQYYYIGADGSTSTGPTIPSFEALAEMHPSGEWVSLLDAINPLTGKQVYVDYIPNEMKIRVFTYYPDSEYDTDKPYIFNFGSDYAINVEAW